MGRCISALPLELYSLGILSGAGSRFRFHASCHAREIARNTPKPAVRSSGNTPMDLARTYSSICWQYSHCLAGTATTFSRSHSTDGNHHRRALSRIAVSRTVINYYHSSDLHAPYILIPLLHGFKGISNISQYLHLYVLWSDLAYRIIIRW